jgi:hypothetical protein
MKRLMVISSLALLVAFYPGSVVANAQQHGHSGSGMGNMGGGMPGTHGTEGTHAPSSSTGTGTGHAGSMGASTNPGDVLDHNSHLSAKLEGLLGISNAGQPSALTTLKNDASGFKNFGQFVAAVHVSQNLDIPFADLKAKMTGPNAVSLGKAIQELKPDTDAKTEAKKATKQANDEMKETS